ncbi:MerR family transcriptional regulator [Winogradskyella bathintestinalis]|uniref:MerR family transcriptional regulator n=1 Tax=Winogradskyella bathintestinalis TaxID=3035208 RepID=A0ABT7ZWX0_9FLAO|nr:MerR family transcriptional regulator [Winogradskyella bathintestinalis]MDN3493329.1 MerR family transcriptional regulator [Winogradskyella bathintestinalis]
MNNIQDTFSIKDLENLTGIKAHTIRIWEKRYNLLEPNRTETNIRYYDLNNFQKLLNVSYLNNNGYKISKIAKLDADKIPELVRKIADEADAENHALNSFKLAMVNFDQTLFYKTYNSLEKEKTFEEIFYEVFIPLLSEIGLLWQTNTITPAHEHFISILVRHKILINTELIQASQVNKSTKIFVLYLPDNEIHELGLMFINHQLVKYGYHSIFLGQSVPIESLAELQSYYDEITFISYFTVKPERENLEAYLEDFENTILNNSKNNLWILGQMINALNIDELPKGIRRFDSIQNLIKEIKA